MSIPERYVYLMFQIDTNRINARQALDNMNMLERWHADGVIILEMSQPSLAEALSGGNKDRTAKAAHYIYSKTFCSTPNEKQILQRIEGILFPQGASSNSERNDVEIVFNAAKYHCVLITNDGGSKSQPGGILGNADKLKREVDVTVMTDKQATEAVRQAIDERDRMARCVAQNGGVKLPDWVGKD